MKTMFWHLPFWFMVVGFVSLLAQIKNVELPAPKTQGKISLEEVLWKRKSVRAYSQEPLRLEEVSQLLWAAQGITHDEKRRTAPSAGATYPLEIYLAVNRVEGLAPGIYHYINKSHSLELTKTGNFGKALRDAALGPDMLETAAVNIVVTAVYERTSLRYGERAPRYVHMEVGHVGQNIYLQAEALGLGTVAVGAFDDEKVQSLMGIEEKVLYILPVGKL